MEKRPYTIITDIDGCLVEHTGSLTGQLQPNTLLPGVLEKFNEWNALGYRIVLVTGRPESMRKFTEDTLHALGLFWDCLVTGIGGGKRILINDLKPDSDEPTAIAVNLRRNVGLENVNV